VAQIFKKFLGRKRVKEDSKSFYAYARSRSKSKVNVGSLTDSSNELISEPKVKVEILNDFFAHVFTVEKETDIPLLDTFLGDKLVNFKVDTGIIKSKHIES